jgi:hypothetical protein
MTAVLEPQIVGPPTAITDPETDRRYYLHPVTGERFVSVTTVLSIIEKLALPYWYGKMAADAVLDNMLALVRSIHVQACAPDDIRCGRCLSCLISTIRNAGNNERDAAADRGTRFHHVAEHYALTGEIIPHDDDIAGNVFHFLRFVNMHKVTFQAAEVTVIDRDDMTGGTLDTVITCGWMPPKHRDLIGVPLYADYKTGSHIYEQAALQLAKYRRSQAALLPDGTEARMPDGHSEVGLSIQIRPDNFWVRPVAVCEQAHAKFRHALALWRDINEPDLDLVGRAMYKPRPKPATTA